jgi:nucleotide-binding universal stress UspA family protein
MLRRILVTLDGSEFAEAALGAAVGLARKAGAQLRLLSVNDAGWALVRGEWSAAGQARARRYLDHTRELIEPLWADVGVVLRSGFAVEEILAEADEFGADLIVMATHGRGPLSRFWLGSVADQCLRRGHRPLLLVRPRDASAPLGEGSLAVQRVVVPLDGSELSETALDSAMEVAQLFASPITLLRVVHDQTYLGSDLFPPEALEVARQWSEEDREGSDRYLTGVVDWLRDWGIPSTEKTVVSEHAAPAIVREAQDSLVVMATHARKGIGRAFLGSVADAVVRAAQGPVLVIPPETVPAHRLRPPVDAAPLLPLAAGA